MKTWSILMNPNKELLQMMRDSRWIYDQALYHQRQKFFETLKEGKIKTSQWHLETDEFGKELYKDYHVHVIEAKRNINSNGKKRGKVEEVIITNFLNER